MKSATLIPITLILSALAAFAVTTFMLESQGAADTLANEEEFSADLARTQNRMGELQEEMDALKVELGRQGQIRAELASARADLQRLQALEKEVAALRANRPATDDVVVANLEVKPEVEDLLAKRIKKELDAGMRKQRVREMQRFMPFVKAGITRTIPRTAKKLKLNKEQTKRLEKSVNKAVENMMPHFAVIMDPSRSTEEREEAFEGVEESFGEVNDEAESFMNPEQLEEFGNIQQESIDGINRFRGFFGGGQQGQGGGTQGGTSGGNPQNL